MNRILISLVVLGVAACSGGSPSESNPTPRPAANATPAPAPSPGPAPAGPDDPTAQPHASPIAQAGVPATDARASRPAPAPPAPVPPGHDFIDLAREYFRVAACAGDEPLPERFNARYIDRHCKVMQASIDRWNQRWTSRAEPFFKEHVPADLPRKVVYPFAGADLITALVVFPEFDELTTLSLEPVGDPREITSLPRPQLEAALTRVNSEFRHLVSVNHSKTLNMIEFMRAGKLPAHLIFSLAALRVRGFVPTSLRYFEIEPDGSLRYLTDGDVAGLDVKNMRRRNEFFGSAELRFARADGAGGERVYRHIQANLANGHLAKDNRVLAHLQAKGRIAAMTKAASFLLSASEFSAIRDYLLDNMVWMVSDATGIPPKNAAAKGFEQVTWGKFAGPLFGGEGRYPQFIKLWKTNPYQKLPFRFGYPDSKRQDHMMVTRKPSA